MKATFFLWLMCSAFQAVCAQDAQPGKVIFRSHKDAVVLVQAGNELGTGFIVSSDGTIITANHVVTTRESQNKQYATEINVAVTKGTTVTIYPATPIQPTISDDQVNFDYAKLRIKASGLSYVELGDWNEVDVGDPVIILPFAIGQKQVMLQGTVSNKSSTKTDLGPKPVDTILFQSPVRNGFSGSPIFSSKGHVIGIVTTKVFGISPTLDTLRNKWIATQYQGGVAIMGIDLRSSFLELIQNLDQNLISGLGSAVAIGYAK